jgi:hypothetical protein
MSDVDRTFSTASAVTSDNASRPLRRYRGSPTGVLKFGDLVELNMEMSLESPPVSSLSAQKCDGGGTRCRLNQGGDHR